MNIHNEHKETIGERIRRLRKERNLPQSFLADATGVTFGWISQIEQDKANASPELLNKIAVALKVPIRELLLDEDERMELISRIKLIEVLLETDQTDEAESMLRDLEELAGLADHDKYHLSLLTGECRYKQRRYEDGLSILETMAHALESVNYHDAYFLAKVFNQIGSCYFQMQDFKNAFYHYRKAHDLQGRYVEFDFYQPGSVTTWPSRSSSSKKHRKPNSIWQKLTTSTTGRTI